MARGLHQWDDTPPREPWRASNASKASGACTPTKASKEACETTPFSHVIQALIQGTSGTGRERGALWWRLFRLLLVDPMPLRFLFGPVFLFRIQPLGPVGGLSNAGGLPRFGLVGRTLGRRSGEGLCTSVLGGVYMDHVPRDARSVSIDRLEQSLAPAVGGLRHLLYLLYRGTAR